MPNQRASGQKQIIVTMKEDFLSIVDGNLEQMGFGDRAHFIRTAVLEKLARAGIEVAPVLSTPPSRAGKGGRPAKKAGNVQQFPEKMEAAKVAESADLPASEEAPRKTSYRQEKRPKKKAKD